MYRMYTLRLVSIACCVPTHAPSSLRALPVHNGRGCLQHACFSTGLGKWPAATSMSVCDFVKSVCGMEGP